MRLKILLTVAALGMLTSTPSYAKHHHHKKAAVKPAPIISSGAIAPSPNDADNILNLELSTGGRVSIALRPDKAPNHIFRIKQLVRARFYDGVIFHRVIEGFMAQTGDPKGDGTGGSPLPNLKAEFNDLPHLRGTMSMARADDNDSANSQFFICFMPVLKLDGKYTALGRVKSGMAFVDNIVRGEPPANPSKIIHAWIQKDGPDAPAVPLVAPIIDPTPVPLPAANTK